MALPTPEQLEKLAEELEARIAEPTDERRTLVLVSEGINTVLDNWQHWDDARLRRHLRDLQTVIHREGLDDDQRKTNHAV